MTILGRALLLAGAALPLANLAAAQTIKQDGQVIAADETSIAPAGESLSTDSDAEEFTLTDAVLANLTALDLSNVSLFQFADETAVSKRAQLSCKTFPGDLLWPSKLVWKVFDLLTGGAVIETVPIGAVCFKNNEHYDEAKCQDILDHWTESATHARDPTSVMSPLFQGKTCMPQDGDSGDCELGGFPSYSVNVSNIAQIQLAINFARNLNLRLVVHNTGHDFLGKSTGAGALSIWTHNLKKVEFIENYSGPSSYTGPALKVGSGIQVGEIYAAAHEYGVTAVGGECKGVGVAGGYMAGGGHSPLMSKYGMGADQVLSIDVVLPSGRFVTADEKQNTDLFWAIRGGGGATFGVVTGLTLKVHPKMPFSGMTFVVTSGNDTAVSNELFWSVMYAYWRRFDGFAERGSYGYGNIFPRFDGVSGYTWTMLPWLVPGLTLDEFKAEVAPLLAEFEALGFTLEPEWFGHDNFYDTWTSHFPVEGVANANLRTGSRIFPAKYWEDAAALNATLDALRAVIEAGSGLIQYNMKGRQPEGTADSAINPAWRDSALFGIIGYQWADGATEEEIRAINLKLRNEALGSLREVSPEGGSYLNEGDVMEPDFQQAFFGSHYDRLLDIKNKYDPWDTFWAPTAVGSEGWYITRQEDYLVTQTGRLCRK
ncbi:putative fad linked oxidase-like protein [Eutypa lata UCREL1]|uniref:Putative fad linked oxidase-like protein n=1 Tax=Eutypa lata (strain UCR-EL1) TaxID=1287681 RepID=M7TII2_EUTLA|nr:putative fad linked oxidase-like protein [Eutypa lata UCREL1]